MHIFSARFSPGGRFQEDPPAVAQLRRQRAHLCFVARLVVELLGRAMGHGSQAMWKTLGEVEYSTINMAGIYDIVDILFYGYLWIFYFMDIYGYSMDVDYLKA